MSALNNMYTELYINVLNMEEEWLSQFLSTSRRSRSEAERLETDDHNSESMHINVQLLQPQINYFGSF